MTLDMDNGKKNLGVESTHPISIFGDIDVLLKMRLHYVSKSLFDQNVPRELHKYIPRSYLESLRQSEWNKKISFKWYSYG